MDRPAAAAHDDDVRRHGAGAGGMVAAAAGCGTLGVLVLAAVAVAGPSAASPGLGRRTLSPPWNLDLRPSSALVSVLLGLSVLLGAAAVALGLLAVRHGACLRAGRPARRLALTVGMSTALLCLLPPVGSADHLSYAAYGRIAALGGDPYAVTPADFRSVTATAAPTVDPVVDAAQPPWRDTVSVYGPVATAIQAGAALVGAGSVRRTVWAWQLVVGASWLLTGWLLDRLVRPNCAARARAAVLWSANPLLLGSLVGGAHLDALCAAFSVAALATTRRSPLAAGALLGALAGSKPPYAAVGLALVVGLRRVPRRQALRTVGLGALGALVVLVPAHLWAGVNAYHQLGRASRYVSLATFWRPVTDVLAGRFGHDQVRAAVPLAFAGLAVLVLLAVAALLPRPATALADPVLAEAVPLLAALGTAYLLAAPYVLPWYDALAWAPLALLTASLLDAVLLARLAVLALAYVPGRVTGMSPQVERITLGFRSQVAPWLLAAVLVGVLGAGLWALWNRRSGAVRPGSSR